MVSATAAPPLTRPALNAVAKRAGAKLFYRSTDGNFVLFQGDSRNVLAALKEFEIELDLIYADPPY